jgi:hypothetical protein
MLYYRGEGVTETCSCFEGSGEMLSRSSGLRQRTASGNEYGKGGLGSWRTEKTQRIQSNNAV